MVGLKNMAIAAVAALPAFTFGGSLLACSAEIDRFNNRISVASDGSFKNANILGEYPFGDVVFFDNSVDSVSGNPIQDRGNGKIAQRLFFSSYACDGHEALLFVDCNTMEGILLAGMPPPDLTVQSAGYSWTEIRWIQPPNGPIAITEDSTVESLQQVAMRHEILFSLDVEGLLGEITKRDRYDPFLGCEIYYPDKVQDG
jgi:hypothetical protein